MIPHGMEWGPICLLFQPPLGTFFLLFLVSGAKLHSGTGSPSGPIAWFVPPPPPLVPRLRAGGPVPRPLSAPLRPTAALRSTECCCAAPGSPLQTRGGAQSIGEERSREQSWGAEEQRGAEESRAEEQSRAEEGRRGRSKHKASPALQLCSNTVQLWRPSGTSSRTPWCREASPCFSSSWTDGARVTRTITTASTKRTAQLSKAWRRSSRTDGEQSRHTELQWVFPATAIWATLKSGITPWVQGRSSHKGEGRSLFLNLIRSHAIQSDRSQQ